MYNVARLGLEDRGRVRLRLVLGGRDRTTGLRNSIRDMELRDLKCFRIRCPLHVRVFRVAFSRGRHAFKLCTYR